MTSARLLLDVNDHAFTFVYKHVGCVKNSKDIGGSKIQPRLSLRAEIDGGRGSSLFLFQG